MISFVTCEISLGQHVCELVFGVNIFNLDFGSSNQSRATLWVLETCLIVGLLPFLIILITASLSSNTYNKASWWEDLTFEGIKSTLSKSLITLWDCLRFWTVRGGERTSRLFINRSPCSLWLWFVFPRTATIRSHESSAGIPSNLNPASKEMISDSVELCETESLFLAHPTYWHERVTSQNAQCSTSRSPAITESWNSPNLHCFAVFPTWQCCL